MPTIDPKDMPSSTRSGSYEVTSFQTSLQRSFERWLEAPSPTSERLVDQSLISAGREPLFVRGRATGQMASPPRVTGRAAQFRNASGRFTTPGYSGPGYAAPEFNRPSYAQQAASYSSGASTTSVELTRLFKHIDRTLDEIKRAEQRIVYLNENAAGQNGGISTRWGGGGSGGQGRPISAGWAGGPTMPPPPGTGFTMPNFPGAMARGIVPFTPGGGGAGGGGGALAPRGLGGGPGGGGGIGAAGAVSAGAAGFTFENVFRLIKETAQLPLKIGKAVYGGYTESKPYSDLTIQIANLTRLTSGGRSDARIGLEKQLLPFNEPPPEWMTRLGATPEDVTGILHGLGGIRPGQGSGMDVAKHMRELQLGTGFNMLPEGPLELGRTAMKYGIGSLSTPGAFGTAASSFMAQGQAAGADPRDLLESIKIATEQMAKGGVKLDIDQISGLVQFLRAVQSTGMPEAHSGVMGGQIAAGFEGSLQHPLRDPLAAAVTSHMVGHINWNDREDVFRATGRYPEEIFKSGPKIDQNDLKILQSSAQGNPDYQAILAGGRLMSGNPKTAMPMAAQALRSIMPGDDPRTEQLRQMAAGRIVQGGRPEGAGFLEGADTMSQEKYKKPIRGADRPEHDTLPLAAFSSRVEAFTALFRGMYVDFEIFGRHIARLNREFEAVMGGANKRFREGGEPSFDSLNFNENMAWWKKILGLGGSSPGGLTGIPAGGQPLPGGGYEAPVPPAGRRTPGRGYGAQNPAAAGITPSFGAPGEYGTGQGTTPSGGSRIPGTVGRLGPQSFEAISKAEGTFGSSGINYNMLPGGSVDPDLSNKTLAEAAGISRNLGDGVGGFQIIGSNIIAGARDLGLDPNTAKFTPEVQQRLANWVHDQQGMSAWHGFRGKPDLQRQFQGGLDKGSGGGPSGAASAAPTGGGGNFSWGRINPLSISPALADTAPLSASALPPGYTLRGTSGNRPGDSGAHGRGLAADFEILDPQRNVIDNRGGDHTGMYTRWAHGWYNAVLKLHPELAKDAQWGGEFGTQKGGGGPDDLMHVDFMGQRGSRPKEGWRFADPNALSASLASDATSSEPARSPLQVNRAPAAGADQSGGSYGGGGDAGRQNFNWDAVHDAVGTLGNIAKEAGEHINEFGKRARSSGGQDSGFSHSPHGYGKTLGPNANTSPSPSNSAQAYP